MKFPLGKILITIVGLLLICGTWLADYNATHVFKPNWPPHAKFHNGQTMFLGTFLGILTLAFLWTGFLRTTATQKICIAAITASLYWLAQLGAYCIPGTALIDPDLATGNWRSDNKQLYLAAVVLILIMLGVILELKRQKTIKANFYRSKYIPSFK